MHDSRLERQLHFIWEIDKLKNILRQSQLIDVDRRENRGAKGESGAHVVDVGHVVLLCSGHSLLTASRLLCQ